jgi:hypothetical protein
MTDETTDPAPLPPPPPAPEEPQMEIHKPKPVHSWREFLAEIGVIVIGVLIALGLEQVVEAIHDRSRVAQARENIRSEIADDLGSMATRDKTNGCISHRLDEVDGLIRASAAGSLPQGPIWIGSPFIGGLANNQYTSATQSGAVSLMPNQEQAANARIYVLFEGYNRAELDEAAAWGDLRTLANHPAGSPVLDWQLRSAMQKARTTRFIMEASGNSIHIETARLGIRPNIHSIIKLSAVCIPLNTPRAEAEREAVGGSILPGTVDRP